MEEKKSSKKKKGNHDEITKQLDTLKKQLNLKKRKLQKFERLVEAKRKYSSHVSNLPNMEFRQCQNESLSTSTTSIKSFKENADDQKMTIPKGNGTGLEEDFNSEANNAVYPVESVNNGFESNALVPDSEFHFDDNMTCILANVSQNRNPGENISVPNENLLLFCVKEKKIVESSSIDEKHQLELRLKGKGIKRHSSDDSVEIDKRPCIEATETAFHSHENNLLMPKLELENSHINKVNLESKNEQKSYEICKSSDSMFDGLILDLKVSKFVTDLIKNEAIPPHEKECELAGKNIESPNSALRKNKCLRSSDSQRDIYSGDFTLETMEFKDFGFDDQDVEDKAFKVSNGADLKGEVTLLNGPQFNPLSAWVAAIESGNEPNRSVQFMLEDKKSNIKQSTSPTFSSKTPVVHGIDFNVVNQSQSKSSQHSKFIYNPYTPPAVKESTINDKKPDLKSFVNMAFLDERDDSYKRMSHSKPELQYSIGSELDVMLPVNLVNKISQDIKGPADDGFCDLDSKSFTQLSNLKEGCNNIVEYESLNKRLGEDWSFSDFTENKFLSGTGNDHSESFCADTLDVLDLSSSQGITKPSSKPLSPHKPHNIDNISLSKDFPPKAHKCSPEKARDLKDHKKVMPLRAVFINPNGNVNKRPLKGDDNTDSSEDDQDLAERDCQCRIMMQTAFTCHQCAVKGIKNKPTTASTSSAVTPLDLSKTMTCKENTCRATSENLEVPTCSLANCASRNDEQQNQTIKKEVENSLILDSENEFFPLTQLNRPTSHALNLSIKAEDDQSKKINSEDFPMFSRNVLQHLEKDFEESVEMEKEDGPSGNAYDKWKRLYETSDISFPSSIEENNIINCFIDRDNIEKSKATNIDETPKLKLVNVDNFPTGQINSMTAVFFQQSFFIMLFLDFEIIVYKYKDEKWARLCSWSCVEDGLLIYKGFYLQNGYHLIVGIVFETLDGGLDNKFFSLTSMTSLACLSSKCQPLIIETFFDIVICRLNGLAFLSAISDGCSSACFNQFNYSCNSLRLLTRELDFNVCPATSVSPAWFLPYFFVCKAGYLTLWKYIDGHCYKFDVGQCLSSTSQLVHVLFPASSWCLLVVSEDIRDYPCKLILLNIHDETLYCVCNYDVDQICNDEEGNFNCDTRVDAVDDTVIIFRQGSCKLFRLWDGKEFATLSCNKMSTMCVTKHLIVLYDTLGKLSTLFF